MAPVEKGKYLTENNLFEKTFHQMAKIHHQKKKVASKALFTIHSVSNLLDQLGPKFIVKTLELIIGTLC